MEIVDLLETLDTDDDVPETMQRRRAQDNFNQRKCVCLDWYSYDANMYIFLAQHPNLD